MKFKKPDCTQAQMRLSGVETGSRESPDSHAAARKQTLNKVPKPRKPTILRFSPGFTTAVGSKTQTNVSIGKYKSRISMA